MRRWIDSCLSVTMKVHYSLTTQYCTIINISILHTVVEAKTEAGRSGEQVLQGRIKGKSLLLSYCTFQGFLHRSPSLSLSASLSSPSTAFPPGRDREKKGLLRPLEWRQSRHKQSWFRNGLPGYVSMLHSATTVQNGVAWLWCVAVWRRLQYCMVAGEYIRSTT